MHEKMSSGLGRQRRVALHDLCPCGPATNFGVGVADVAMIGAADTAQLLDQRRPDRGARKRLRPKRKPPGFRWHEPAVLESNDDE